MIDYQIHCLLIDSCWGFFKLEDFGLQDDDCFHFGLTDKSRYFVMENKSTDAKIIDGLSTNPKDI